MGLDFYATLGVQYDATPEEIRNAYFLLVRQLHPDANPTPEVKEQFLAVQQAYEVLSNPKKRADYNQSLPAEQRTGPQLSLNFRYSRSYLPQLNEPQLMYVLFDILCTADLASDALLPSHVCLVLDKSTSMQGDRMDMVKLSALNLIQQLRGQDMISVVSFGDRAEVVIPPTRASQISRSDSRINLLQPSGGTELLKGLTLGVDQLRLSSPTYSRHLILFTDGHTYGDDQDCLDLGRQAAVEGISFSIFGIGHEWNDALMDQLASITGGNCSFINSHRELDQYIQMKMRALESVYARGIHFDYQSTPGVELRYAFRLSPDTGPIPVSNPMPVGDISFRKSISILLEFFIPPLAHNIDRVTLAKGAFRMVLPNRMDIQPRLMADLYREVRAENDNEVPPLNIVEALSRLTLYRMQEKVRREVEAGQIDKATRRLQHLATHLLSQGERELAHTVLVEAEHLKQSHHFSKDGDKRIKYGTRAFLLPAAMEPKV